MKNFLKSISTELVLALITAAVIVGLYMIYGAVETGWVRVPAMIVTPIVVVIVYFQVVPDDPEMYRDSVFFTWVACMLAVFGMQFYLAYPSWGIVGYFIIDFVVGFIGAFFSACAVCSAVDPYE